MLNKILVNSIALSAVCPDYLRWGQRKKNHIDRLDRVFRLGYPKPIVSLSTLNKKKDEMRDRFNINDDDFIVLYIGSLASKLRINCLYDAFSELEDSYKLIFIGEGDIRKKLEVKSQNIDNILIAGWCNDVEIASLLAISQLGVYPYPDDCFNNDHLPNKIIEYFSAGLPLLSQIKSPEMIKFLTDNNCGFVYEDVESLKNIITELCCDPERLARIAGNCKDLYLREFQAETIYQKMADYLVRVIPPQ